MGLSVVTVVNLCTYLKLKRICPWRSDRLTVCSELLADISHMAV